MSKSIKYDLYVFNKKSTFIDHIDTTDLTTYKVSTHIINEVTKQNKESVAGYRKVLGDLVKDKLIEIRGYEVVL